MRIFLVSSLIIIFLAVSFFFLFPKQNGQLLFSNSFLAGLKIADIFSVEKGKVLGAVEENFSEAGGAIVELPKESNNMAAGEVEELSNKAEQITKFSILKLSEYTKNQNQPINKDQSINPRRLTNVDEPEILAKSGAVVDGVSNFLLFSKNADQAMPIASITKLMTVLVWLDYNPGWEYVYEIKKEDRRDGGKIYLFPGEKVTVENLFYLSLVGSANTATMALINSLGLSEAEFVEKMNDKAVLLGLNNTHFSDPVGLSNNNVSTAREVAQLANAALSHKDIRQATLAKRYEFTTVGGEKKIVYSTDYLLENFPENGIKIIGGKTGYTEAAGFCFVGEFINQEGKEIVSVVLGSQSNNNRFQQTEDLVQWTYNNYQW